MRPASTARHQPVVRVLPVRDEGLHPLLLQARSRRQGRSVGRKIYFVVKTNSNKVIVFPTGQFHPVRPGAEGGDDAEPPRALLSDKAAEGLLRVQPDRPHLHGARAGPRGHRRHREGRPRAEDHRLQALRQQDEQDEVLIPVIPHWVAIVTNSH